MPIIEVSQLTREVLALEQTLESVNEITVKFRESDGLSSVCDFRGDDDGSLP